MNENDLYMVFPCDAVDCTQGKVHNCDLSATRAGTKRKLSRLGPIAEEEVSVDDEGAGEAHSLKARSSERCEPNAVVVVGVVGDAPVVVEEDDSGHTRFGDNSKSGFEMSTPVWGTAATVIPGACLAVPRSLRIDTSSGIGSDALSLELLSLSLSSSETFGNTSTMEASLDATSMFLSCSASCAASFHACMSAATALWFLPHLSGCGGSRPKS